jgi:hypothetical protein
MAAESFWCIQRGLVDNPEFLSIDNGVILWSIGYQDAIRFQREVDASRFTSILNLNIVFERVAEYLVGG